MRLLNKKLTLKSKIKRIFVKYVLFLFFVRIVAILH